MRLLRPIALERFGAVSIYGIQKTYQIDTPSISVCGKFDNNQMYLLTHEKLEEILKQFAIVVSVKNERLKLVEGTLSAIPSNCYAIIVSNSSRAPVNRYKMEYDMVKQFCDFVPLDTIMVHQRDPGLSELMKKCGFEVILDKNGLIRNGKAEGMLLGVLLAWAKGKKYIGFVDSDNYVPGAVYEYIKNFAAGIAMAKSLYVNVRISWIYKPKYIEGEVYFKRLGRISKRGNYFLNLMISGYSGFETEIIRTANAGDHALTIELARLLQFSHGFSIEPYQLINMFEQFSGVLPPTNENVMSKGIEIYQIETRNPHFHEDKGENHINEMYRDLFSVIYHSPLCPEFVKNIVLDEYKEKGLGKHPPKPIIYPALSEFDINIFRKHYKKKVKSLYLFNTV